MNTAMTIHLKMLHLILLFLPGVLNGQSYSVTNPSSICGVRGSKVTISCQFTYPNDKQLTKLTWCQNVSVNSHCDRVGPYVYDSSKPYSQINFRYTGNNISDCSLSISDINSTYSGVYLFRFMTDSKTGQFTSNPGTRIIVTELNISMTRLRENGSITVGESLNLTCTPVSCPINPLEFQWLKDNKPTRHNLGPILSFTKITLEDSGNYSCALKNFMSSASKQIRLYVEGTDSRSTTLFWVLIAGVCIPTFIFIVVAVGLVSSRRRAKVQDMLVMEEKTTEMDEVTQTVETEDVSPEEEVQYASLNIKPKEVSANSEQQGEDSTIYSAVKVPGVKGKM